MTVEGDQTREKLLTLSRDLYLEKGLTGFSLREVARRAGLSAPAIYRHYDSKEALLSEVCSEGFRIFASYLLRALDAGSPRQRMAASTQLYLQFGLEHPRYYRFIFMGPEEDFVPLAPPKDKPEPTFQFLVDRVRECIDAELISAAEPYEIATRIWAHVHGLVALRLSGHLAGIGNDDQFRKFYTRATDELIAGMAP
jgi:AcrR family transcriptional regulator